MSFMNFGQMASGPSAASSAASSAGGSLFGSIGSALGPISIGLGVVSGVMGFMGKSQARKAAKAHAAQVESAAKWDAYQQFRQIARKDENILAAAADQIRNISRAQSLQTGSVRAGAGSAGVEGASVDAVEADFEKVALTQVLATDRDLETNLANTQLERAAIGSQAANRINQARSAVPQKPSVFGSLLEIGTSAIQTANSFK
jgi:hypothetical protein